MTPELTLSRRQLADFLACQRRFQLRYLEHLPWPAAPTDDHLQQSLLQGQLFHQLLQRYFLGVTPDEDALGSDQLRQWWQAFQQHGPALPPGRRLPELTLTVPIGRHLLTGRFDLLVLGENQAHIFDWKTEARPRREADLRADLQTRLYLALLAEGSQALVAPGAPLATEAIAITYWYANDPAQSVTIPYSQAEHEQNWAELRAVVAAIEHRLEHPTIWPLTENLNECGRCAYQVFCDRQVAIALAAAIEPAEDEALEETNWQLEPEIP
jgi:hypothetical protein